MAWTKYRFKMTSQYT